MNTSLVSNRLKVLVSSSYFVVIGIIDKLSLILSSIRGSISDVPEESRFVRQIIALLNASSKLLTLFPSCNSTDMGFGVKLVEDDTQFMLTLRVNQLCGTVSMLYGFLLHSGAPVRNDNEPVVVPEHTLSVALEVIRFINNIALLDIEFIQVHCPTKESTNQLIYPYARLVGAGRRRTFVTDSSLVQLSNLVLFAPFGQQRFVARSHFTYWKLCRLEQRESGKHLVFFG